MKEIDRILRDDYFMLVAEVTSLRGTCNRLKVGAVLVNEKRIVSVGYNSSISDTPHCSEKGCLIENGHCKRCPHAEAAAVANLPRRFNFLICYVTHQPCVDCFKLLVTAGVKHIFYLYPYASESRDQLRKESGILMVQYEYKVNHRRLINQINLNWAKNH